LILVILGFGFGWAGNWFYFLQGWFCDCIEFVVEVKNKCWRILCEMHKENILGGILDEVCEGLVATICCFNDHWFFWHKEKV
jgi:hypothetical protein